MSLSAIVSSELVWVWKGETMGEHDRIRAPEFEEYVELEMEESGSGPDCDPIIADQDRVGNSAVIESLPDDLETGESGESPSLIDQIIDEEEERLATTDDPRSDSARNESPGGNNAPARNAAPAENAPARNVVPARPAADEEVASETLPEDWETGECRLPSEHDEEWMVIDGEEASNDETPCVVEEDEPHWATSDEIDPELADRMTEAALFGEDILPELTDQIPPGVLDITGERVSRPVELPEPVYDESLIRRPTAADLEDPESPCAGREGVCAEVPWTEEQEEEEEPCLFGSLPEEGHDGPYACLNWGRFEGAANTNITDGRRTDMLRGSIEGGLIDGPHGGDRLGVRASGSVLRGYNPNELEIAGVPIGIEGGIGEANVEASVGSDGASFGATAVVGNMGARAGNIEEGDDLEGHANFSLGVGFGGRVRISDVNNNGRLEAGVGADIGPATFDVAAEQDRQYR
jgi:hypothetical protein